MAKLGIMAYLPIILLFASIPMGLALTVTPATILVDETTAIAYTDDNFVCATIDWWPPEKCDYNRCSWGNSSALNLDLSHPLLAAAVQAFGQLRIRVGGSLQDQLIYDLECSEDTCKPFRKTQGGLFGFSHGCLCMKRWDELNKFFQKTGVILTFGLNALYGRHKKTKTIWGGYWNSSNARDFIEYTISKGYKVDSWELGNELSGSGVEASVDVELYAQDVIELKNIIENLYKNEDYVPSIAAPGGFFEQWWYSRLLKKSGSNVVNLVTHHIYNLGSGSDPQLISKILNPEFLGKAESTFRNVEQTIKRNGSWGSAWVGEAGGAYNSGGRHISNTFVDSFWYLDQLGMSSKHNTKVYCRQALIGGNYGLLSRHTFVPNPDYYSALLWHRLMGKGVLSAHHNASHYLRSYVHCTKERAGITLLLINLSNNTEFVVNVQNVVNETMVYERGSSNPESIFMRLKRSVSWDGRQTSEEERWREEYHLTPNNGYLQSQTMVLNGNPLYLTEEGNIPTLQPVLVECDSPIHISSLSIAFIVLPFFDAYGCS